MPESKGRTELQLKVEGMSCQHCVAAVTEAVESVPGVEASDVDLASGMVKVAGPTGVDRQQLLDAIRAAGYEAS
jgi:copper chaperone CopZ